MDFMSVPEILREPLTRWWERVGAIAAFLDAYAALPLRIREEMPRIAAGSEFIAVGTDPRSASAQLVQPVRAAVGGAHRLRGV